MATVRCYPDLSKLDAGQGHHMCTVCSQTVRVGPRLGRRSWAAPSTSRAPRTGTILRVVRLHLFYVYDTGQVTTDSRGPHRRSGSPLDPVDAAGPRRQHRGRRSRVERGRPHRCLGGPAASCGGLGRSAHGSECPHGCRPWRQFFNSRAVRRSGGPHGPRTHRKWC